MTYLSSNRGAWGQDCPHLQSKSLVDGKVDGETAMKFKMDLLKIGKTTAASAGELKVFI